MSLRIKQALKEFGTDVGSLIGNDPQNPLVKSPQYFIQVFERKTGDKLKDTFRIFTSSVVSENTTNILSGSLLDDTNNQRLSQKRLPLRYLFTGTLPTEFQGVSARSIFSGVTGFDYLDVDMETYEMRQRKSPLTTIKISNPSKDKKNILKRGNIIKVYMGWIGVDIKEVFTGIIAKSEEEWDQMASSDYYINIDCIRYHDSIVNSTSFTDVVKGNIEIEDLTSEDMTINIDGDYYAGWHNLINVINKIIEPIYGVTLKTDLPRSSESLSASFGVVGFRSIQRDNDTTKFTIEAEKFRTIGDVLDTYLKHAVGAGRGKNPLRWYIDTAGNIQFPYADDTNETKKIIVIGDNAYGAKILKDEGITPQFKLDEPFAIGEGKLRVKISMSGRNDYRVGDPVLIKQYNATSLSTEDPSSLSDEIITKDKERVFIIDQINHVFVSYESYDTILVVVEPKDQFTPVSVVDSSENSNDIDLFSDLEDRINANMRIYVENEIKQLAILLRTGDGSGGIDGQVQETNRDKFVQDAHAADNSYRITTTYVQNDDIESSAPTDINLTDQEFSAGRKMEITSPYAITHPVNDKFYMAGMWLPISRKPYNEIYQKYLSMQKGSQYFSANQKWVQHNGTVNPMSYDPDFMFRSQRRSWMLMPTEDLDFLDTPILDAGTFGRGSIQSVEEINPLDLDAPIPGTLDRPEIQKIAGEYTTEATDGKGKPTNKKVITVTNKDRTVATKIIIDHDDADGLNPTIHIIVDDQKADGSRMEFTMKDDGTTPLIELINGALTGKLSNGTTPEIVLSTNKDEDADFSHINMTAGALTLEYVDTTTPANSSTMVLENGIISLDAATLNFGASVDTMVLDANVNVKGTMKIDKGLGVGVVAPADGIIEASTKVKTPIVTDQ